MLKMDVSELTVATLRKVLKGEPIIVTHRGQDKFAIMPLDMLYLLEGLQLEELEQESQPDNEWLKALT